MDKEYYVCMEDYVGTKTFSGPYESFDQAEGFKSTLGARLYKNTFVVILVEEQNRGKEKT